MKKMVMRLATFATLACYLAPAAEAVPIVGVTVSSTSSTFAGNIQNTANGSGLLPGQVATATHNQSGGTISWQTFDTINTVNLTFNLNGLFSLAGMAVWNATWVFNTQGIQGVVVSSSTDGVLFNPIVGAPSSFAQGSGLSGTSLAEIFTWAPVAATHVRFNVATNHGGPNLVFNEVLFDQVAVGAPEIGRQGALVSLSIVALTCLVLNRTRRSSSRKLATQSEKQPP